MLQQLLHIPVVVRHAAPIGRQWDQDAAPEQRDEVPASSLHKLFLKAEVSVARRIQALSLLQASGQNEVDGVESEACLLLPATFVVILGHVDVAQRFLVVLHVEVGKAAPAQAVDPAWVQIEALGEPEQCAFKFVKLEVADCQAVQ